MTADSKNSADSDVYRTRSPGIGAEGIPDQYSDGIAAQVWNLYIGSSTARTDLYKSGLLTRLREAKCEKVLDAACGTGVDSVMLLEAGFDVDSVDASDKMLKFALKTRWNRRKEAAFDKWEIDEANWLTLADDLKEVKPAAGYDAIVCLGNSFAHLPDSDEGDQSTHLKAIQGFYDCLKPGGLLLIDHRNYDYILKHGRAPQRNMYYNSERISKITTSKIVIDNKPAMITLDYQIDVSGYKGIPQGGFSKFRLSYYPHTLSGFTGLLRGVFGQKAEYTVLGDFKQLSDDEADPPAYYIHIITKN
jgi:glycine N-methyltransferase